MESPILAVAREQNRQFHCVQELPGKRQGRSLITVCLVTHDWYAQKCKVDSDLVGSACQRMNFQQRVGGIFRLRMIFADRFPAPAWGHHRHPLAADRIPADRSLHPAGGGGWKAIYQGQIGFTDSPSTKLPLHGLMSTVVFRQENDPRCIFIQAVNHARTLHATHALDIRCIGQDRVDQSPR